MIAYVPQQFKPEYAFTVLQLLEMGRYPYHGQFDELSKEEFLLIEYAIEVTGLETLTHKFITELSGGELQRVMIARALVQDTPMIFLDEPISNLDIHYQKEIILLLNKIAVDKKKLIVSVLHDMNVGLNHCDFIHLIHDHKVTSGRPKDVLSLERVEAVYNIPVHKIENTYGEYIHW
jgi:iron complex transport system ATP-binding protein